VSVAPRPFDLVVFDLDGVLVDSNASHSRAYADLWARIGIAGPRFEAVAGMRTAEVVARATAHLRPSDAMLAEWIDFKQTRARHYLDLDGGAFPDAGRAVRALKGACYRVSVGTGASSRTAVAALAASGILPELAALVTADDVTRGKPAPDIFVEAIRRSRGSAERTLVVEDTLVGLEAAEEAGAWSMSVRSRAGLRSARFLGNFPDLDRLVDRILASP
jgi:sugar-phosphatase